MSPDIEPVVSSANTSSTRGLVTGVGVCANGSGSSGARGTGRTETWGRTWEGTARLWRWAPSTASNVRMPPVRIAYVTIFRGGRGFFGCGVGETEGVFELAASMSVSSVVSAGTQTHDGVDGSPPARDHRSIKSLASSARRAADLIER